MLIGCEMRLNLGIFGLWANTGPFLATITDIYEYWRYCIVLCEDFRNESLPDRAQVARKRNEIETNTAIWDMKKLNSTEDDEEV